MASSTLLLAGLLLAGAAHAGMYRWVDGSGRVHYSDTLPATYQQSGAAEMNKQGLVIKRTRSEAERRAEIERLQEDKRAEQERQAQAQADRALTQTYTSSAEIDLARDRALDHHKLVIRGAEIRLAAVEANLADLNGRVASIQKAGRKVSPNLKEQVAQATNERLELKRVMFKNEEALVTVRSRYEADKARFQALTGK